MPPLWLADEAGGNVLAVDPVGGNVAVIIPTGLHPARVSAGEGAVWALDISAGQVIRIHPTRYTIDAVIPILQGDCTDLIAGTGGVWVSVVERPDGKLLGPDDEIQPRGGVVRIDPAGNRVTSYTPTGPASALAQAGGSIWVLARGAVDTPLYRLEADSLQLSPLRLSGTHDWLLEDALAADPGGLWLYSQAFERLYRLDFNGRLLGFLDLPGRKPLGPARLLALEGALWFVTPWGEVLRIDPRTLQITARADLALAPGSLSEAGGQIWLGAPLQGGLYRLDGASAQPAAFVAAGTPLAPTPVITATPIQRASQPCPDGPLSRLAVGKLAYTQKSPAIPNRLRKDPGGTGEEIGFIQPGATVRVVEGPACQDKWVWWKVETLNGGLSGWAAEGDGERYWLFPK